MRLNKIDDPRDALQKATRYQVWQFAKANGLDFPESTPAPIVREALRQRGITRINIRAPVLGAVSGPSAAPDLPPGANGVERDAVADLRMQWEREQARERQARVPENISPAEMGINELRAECKRLGIKLSRRDNMNSMREKIEAHGQNPA